MGPKLRAKYFKHDVSCQTDFDEDLSGIFTFITEFDELDCATQAYVSVDFPFYVAHAAREVNTNWSSVILEDPIEDPLKLSGVEWKSDCKENRDLVLKLSRIKSKVTDESKNSASNVKETIMINDGGSKRNRKRKVIKVKCLNVKKKSYCAVTQKENLTSVLMTKRDRRRRAALEVERVVSEPKHETRRKRHFAEEACSEISRCVQTEEENCVRKSLRRSKCVLTQSGIQNLSNPRRKRKGNEVVIFNPNISTEDNTSMSLEATKKKRIRALKDVGEQSSGNNSVSSKTKRSSESIRTRRSFKAMELNSNIKKCTVNIQRMNVEPATRKKRLKRRYVSPVTPKSEMVKSRDEAVKRRKSNPLIKKKESCRSKRDFPSKTTNKSKRGGNNIEVEVKIGSRKSLFRTKKNARKGKGVKLQNKPKQIVETLKSSGCRDFNIKLCRLPDVNIKRYCRGSKCSSENNRNVKNPSDIAKKSDVANSNNENGIVAQWNKFNTNSNDEVTSCETGHDNEISSDKTVLEARDNAVENTADLNMENDGGDVIFDAAKRNSENVPDCDIVNRQLSNCGNNGKETDSDHNTLLQEDVDELIKGCQVKTICGKNSKGTDSGKNAQSQEKNTEELVKDIQIETDCGTNSTDTELCQNVQSPNKGDGLINDTEVDTNCSTNSKETCMNVQSAVKDAEELSKDAEVDTNCSTNSKETCMNVQSAEKDAEELCKDTEVDTNCSTNSKETCINVQSAVKDAEVETNDSINPETDLNPIAQPPEKDVSRLSDVTRIDDGIAEDADVDSNSHTDCLTGTRVTDSENMAEESPVKIRGTGDSNETEDASNELWEGNVAKLPSSFFVGTGDDDVLERLNRLIRDATPDNETYEEVVVEIVTEESQLF